MIHSEPHLIWPCSLSHPNSHHCPLAHLVQMTLALCHLSKLSSLLDQDPWLCYPSASSSRLSTRLNPSPHLGLCSS